MIINDAKNVSIKNTYIKTPDSVVDVLGGDTISFDNLVLDTKQRALTTPNETIETKGIHFSDGN